MSCLAAITIDYETWQPIPLGRTIDWERDVFRPAERLMRAADQAGAVVTFMAEMGEYFWLERYQPELAGRMRTQWQQAIARGHDVQLHLHTAWLPECGACCENGRWSWDFSKAPAADYPGDLAELLKRCRRELEAVLKPVNPNYRAVAFRAGTYQVQPFRRLFDALLAAGIVADTSVFAGGFAPERGYDFRLAESRHQPYFANPFDPQLEAPPAERQLVELPIFTPQPATRWFLDNDEGPRLVERFEAWQAAERRRVRRDGIARLLRKAGGLLGSPISLSRTLRRRLRHGTAAPPAVASGRPLPQAEAQPATNYYVMIGHTKAELHFEAISTNLQTLRERHGVEFIGLGEMAVRAAQELSANTAPRRAVSQETGRRFPRLWNRLNGARRELARLMNLVPLDRREVLVIGGPVDPLVRTFPWMHFLAASADSERLLSSTGGDAPLPFDDNRFDAVLIAGGLERSADPGTLFSEVARILEPGGALILELARCGSRNGCWRPRPHELAMRLAAAGFDPLRVDPEGRQSETKACGPHGRFATGRAWKGLGASSLARPADCVRRVYRLLEPGEVPVGPEDPGRFLTLGRGLCLAYSLVLGTVLQAEGYCIQWLTMLAEDHPRGRGPERLDSHEAVLLSTQSGQVILDPATGTVIPHALDDVLRCPVLAVPPAEPDPRYRRRRYDLYATAFWYERVVRYRLRGDYRDDHAAWTENPYRAAASGLSRAAG